MCLKAKISSRNRSIALRLIQGDENPEIALHLGISLSNVKGRVRQMCDQLGVCNRTMLAVALVRHDYECIPCRLDHNSIDIPESLVST